jgi:HEAT repeat protein
MKTAIVVSVALLVWSLALAQQRVDLSRLPEPKNFKSDEHVHVLRSAASALGDIGTAAAPAIPALEELRKLPRVRWAAEEAIRKIRS